jgi:hypothetical protein
LEDKKTENGEIIKKKVPILVTEYVREMRGVDILDQSISYYQNEHREYK